jgi:hypothetical protein
MRRLPLLLLLLLFAAPAQASTATAEYTADPSRLKVTIRLDVTVKRPMHRRVFALACRSIPDVVACVDEGQPSKKLKLRKGRNRRTVVLYPQAFERRFVGVQVTGLPWEGTVLAAVAASDLAWWWLGQDPTPATVRVRPVTHDTLRDAKTQGEGEQ